MCACSAGITPDGQLPNRPRSGQAPARGFPTPGSSDSLASASAAAQAASLCFTADGADDNNPRIEEPDDAKAARPVL
jgi:hypothetical protein